MFVIVQNKCYLRFHFILISRAVTPKECWACSQRSGTLSRCSAEQKLGHFQIEGQISGVGGENEVHMTLEDFVTSAFLCDSAVHLLILLQAVSTVSRSTNCYSLNVNNFPVAIDQAPSRDPTKIKMPSASIICKRSLKRRFCQRCSNRQ